MRQQDRQQSYAYAPIALAPLLGMWQPASVKAMRQQYLRKLARGEPVELIEGPNVLAQTWDDLTSQIGQMQALPSKKRSALESKANQTLRTLPPPVGMQQAIQKRLTQEGIPYRWVDDATARKEQMYEQGYLDFDAGVPESRKIAVRLYGQPQPQLGPTKSLGHETTHGLFHWRNDDDNLFNIEEREADTTALMLESRARGGRNIPPQSLQETAAYLARHETTPEIVADPSFRDKITGYVQNIIPGELSSTELRYNAPVIYESNMRRRANTAEEVLSNIKPRMRGKAAIGAAIAGAGAIALGNIYRQFRQ